MIFIWKLVVINMKRTLNAGTKIPQVYLLKFPLKNFNSGILNQHPVSTPVQHGRTRYLVGFQHMGTNYIAIMIFHGSNFYASRHYSFHSPKPHFPLLRDSPSYCKKTSQPL